MIGALLRTDQGILGLKVTTFTLCILLAPLATIWNLEPSDPSFRFIFLSVVLTFWFVGLNGIGPRRRFSEFQLMQPAPPSVQLAVRIAALCLHGLLPLAIITATAVLFGRGKALSVLPLAANLGSAVVFASVVLHLPSPGYDSVVDRSKVLAVLALAVAAIVGVAWIEDPRYSLALLAAAAVLTCAIRRALPPGLLMAAVGERENKPAPAKPSRGASHPRRHLALWILRETSLKGNLAWGIGCAILAVSVPWLAILWLILLTGSACRGLARVGHLPLSRRQLFPYVALPTLWWVVIGFTASSVSHTYLLQGLRSKYEPVDMKVEHVTTSDGESERFSQILVPASHWRLGLGEDAPPTRAPWGEEILPHAYVHTVWGRPIYLYNPYEVSASSSIEFVSWQLSRAVDDVYGARFSPEALRERYLELSKDGAVQIRPRTYTLQEVRSHPYSKRLNYMHPFQLRMDHPGLGAGPPRTLATVLATGFFLCGLAWAPVLYCGLLFNRPPTTLKGAARRKWIIGGSVVLMIVVASGLGYLTFYSNPLSWEWYVPSPFELVMGVTFRTTAEILPGNGLFSWMIVLAVAVALYLFLERVFSRMEIPRSRHPTATT